jgi:hypothetical protein
VYQGEEPYVAANTKIGEVIVDGLEPLPRQAHDLEIKFSLDISGTLAAVCTDKRTGRIYTADFDFDGITRMSADEVKARRAMVAQMMAGAGPAPAVTPPTGQAAPAPTAARAVPTLDPGQIPEDWRDFWLEGQELMPSLDPANKALMSDALAQFAQAVLGGDEADIEDKAYFLQDAILEVQA